MVDISGQTVIVTGASSGMGRATALAFAAQGCKVLAAARREDALKELAQEAEAAGHPLLVKATDVSKKAEVEALIQEGLKQFGHIDVMVNAAGVNVRNRSFADLSDEDWHKMIDINLNGAWYITKGIVGPMKEHGGGLIIHISSVSGRWPDFSGPGYQASKRGLNGLAHATMLEERANGIRISVVMPGLADTPILENRKVKPTRELLDKAMQPEDIASACVFLATLPARTFVPELVIMPGLIHSIGTPA